MKVIGKTDGGYILTATHTEVANLLGYYYVGTARDAGVADPKSGDTIQVAEMYQQLYQIERHRGDVNRFRAMLLEMADNLKTLPPVIDSVVTAPDVKPA